ncbi:MAG: hypothetical protein ACHQET_12870 [Chitinophagales bacterium]
MKAIIVLLSICLASSGIDRERPDSWILSPDAQIFVASTPCDSVSKSLLNIPLTEKCEWMQWKFIIYPSAHQYSLTCRYGMTRPGTRQFGDGSKTIELQGKWTTDHSGVTYTLETNRPGVNLSFLRLGENLFHLLDQNKRLMVGDGGFSYTFNRVSPVSAQASSVNLMPANLPPMSQSSVMGVYLGRTPNDHEAREFNKIIAPQGQITKWRLTLYQDSIAHRPTTFKLETLYVGTGNDMHVNMGRWKLAKGWAKDPEARIYILELNPSNSLDQLIFLQGDGNVLFMLDRNYNYKVGDEYSAYTLNRAKRV